METIDNGTSFSGYERNHLFLHSPGQKKPFRDIAKVSGLDHPGDARVVSRFDFDRDGWLDFAIVNANAPKLQLYRNRIGEYEDVQDHTGVGIRLVGGNHSPTSSPRFSPRDAYGARVLILADDRRIVREWRSGEGMGAQNGTTMWVGLGGVERIESITVRWPSGRITQAKDLPANQLVTLFERQQQGPDGAGHTVEPYLADDARRISTHTPAVFAPDFASETTARLRLFTSMATHCAACARELPTFERLRSSFSTDDVALFAIPTDANEPRERLESYVTSRRPAYELHLDATDAERAAFQAQVLPTTRVEFRPSTIVTDSNGRVLLVKAGPASVSDLTILLRELDSE